MKILFAAVLFFANSLFAQTPATPATQPEVAPKMATVYFYRLREFYANALKPSIFCDQKQVLRMRNGRFLAATFPAGSHTITSNFPGSGLVLEMKAGETYYVRMSIKSASFVHTAKGAVDQVPEGQGRFEVSQLKPAEPEDLKEETAAPDASKK